MNTRVGFGYDVHRLEAGQPFWLGGVQIAHHSGAVGHSDADVLIHAICDALLGAANMRDIGHHFPDNDPRYKGIDSRVLLTHVVALLREKGYRLVNCDLTIMAEQPKINPHVPAMVAALAQAMGCDEDQISIKATTTERLGFTGRGEGIAAQAVALIDTLS